MADLQHAIAYVQDLMEQIEGIRAHPDYPPEQLNVFPFAVAYSGGGLWEFGPGGTRKGLHTIVLEIHVARKDLPRDTQAAMAFSDTVPNVLLANPTLGGNVSTFGQIRYTFGPLGWGGEVTYGFRFFIENVKMETAIT